MVANAVHQQIRVAAVVDKSRKASDFFRIECELLVAYFHVVHVHRFSVHARIPSDQLSAVFEHERALLNVIQRSYSPALSVRCPEEAKSNGRWSLCHAVVAAQGTLAEFATLDNFMVVRKSQVRNIGCVAAI